MTTSRLVRAIGNSRPLCRRQIILQWNTQRMGFSNAPVQRAATPFKMPAMSPTMTEGNIATWKVKEGESFEAGDVLLEIETDKAQMDVEAQDSGILAKIVVPDGTHKVNVGKIIAVLAEEGDDISSIEMPSEETESTTSASSKETTEKPKEEEKQSEEKPTEKKTDHKISISSDETLSPSVLRLLHEYGISDPKTITATGPQGRLLKGDVLVHVGTVESQVIKNLEDILAKKQKLDLDNIVVQKPAPPPSKPTPDVPSAPPPFASIDTNIRLTELVRIQQRLSGILASELPLDSLIDKASARALADVPAFGRRKTPSLDRVFAELIGERQPIKHYPSTNPTSTSHGSFDEELSAPLEVSIAKSRRIQNLFGEAHIHFESFEAAKPPVQREDIFDELLGVNTGKKSPQSTPPPPSTQDLRVRLEYDDATIGADAAAAYLARFQHYLESPSQLVL